jgi:hypothetical protein
MLTGLPAFALSRRPSSSAFDSIASATLSRRSERSCGVVCFHEAKAVSAAFTARSTSSAELAGTVAMTWSLAGLITSAVRPSAASTNSPPMNCWNVLARSRVSVTGWPPGAMWISGEVSPS